MRKKEPRNFPAMAYAAHISALAVSLALVGCASVSQVTGNDDATGPSAQSETSATTSYFAGINRIVVSYNDESGNAGKIVYGATTRLVNTGASMLGWSYSNDGGAHWTYGGKVSPPTGWSVLWGDPAMTTSRTHYGVVFISNLAVPASKMPAGGISGALYGVNGQSPIGGACLARSTDGGVTFSNYQCIRNTSPTAFSDSSEGHFYDGGSMAALSSGAVFAAYVDVYTAQIDVWRSPSDGGAFALLPPPFPGLIVQSHPRIRTAPLDSALYVAAVVKVDGGFSRVYMNRYIDGRWGQPVAVSDSAVNYPTIDFGQSLLGAPLTVRTGPQFSFDVGAESENGVDGIRMLYTRFDAGTQRYFIDAVACNKDLSGCHAVPGWRAGPGAPGEVSIDRYNPNVAAWIGFIGLPPIWTGSYVYRYGKPASTVEVSRQTLGYVNGAPFTIPIDIYRNVPVCPDTRGYWGDYDDHLHVGFNNGEALFARFLTDSSKGCTVRGGFYATPQHVQSVVYPK